MTIYNISAEIKTNTAPENLYYDMELYKADWSGNETFALRRTGKYPLQADNKTQAHPSIDISDPPETSYILSINLYRKVGVEFINMTPEPMTAIVPLKGFQTNDKEWAASRAFEYFETTQPTQKERNGQVNIFQLNISSKSRVFEAKEHGVGDPLDPFTKQKVEDELKIRMTRPIPPTFQFDQLLSLNENQTDPEIQKERRRVLFYPYQDQSMFCGPAAFFYCLQQDRPDIYQQLIKELWESGETKIGALKMEADNSVRHPTKFFRENGTPKIPAIDWITMASLRDTENTALFSINSPSGGFLWWNWAGAVTLGNVLEKWFKKAGASKKYDNISFSHSNLQAICILNNYISTDHHIVSLIRAGMLIRGKNSITKDHWIVWEDQLKLMDGTAITTDTPLTEIVQLKLFSWGEVDQQLEVNLTLEQFLKHTFGGMVFSKIP
ncbi:hypothetical protein [Entomomonas asaccharolytica]|uniref:Uncharacterized protein n=1 Tax=Entomomonas asaccharolytica TaxID=2785331 RepID=A0A974NE14_9GAMM|nr:hypothetical protein [Entomomonas asaccharolytica]QQP84662.1 hypothetical protein JHT90_09595 [Entomomonas asaccharolytica]